MGGKPDNNVTRPEFAKMLITGLNINMQNPKTATFVDVTDDHWAYKEIEASKTYMTWYKQVEVNILNLMMV